MYSIVSVCLQTNISQTLQVNNMKFLGVRMQNFQVVINI